MSKIDIFLIDNSKDIIEEINFIKPNSYQKFLEQIKQKYDNFSENFEIFKLDNSNKEIKIANEEKYKIVENILFIRKIDNDSLSQSIFELNYNKLSQSKKEVIDEKYNCILCSLIIKNENPYLCYRCQTIFHEKCLKEWDKKRKSLNQKLCCPKCRNELPLEQWNKKLDYEDNRKNNANLMNKINELKEKYEKYISKAFEIFKNILNKINSIHSLLNLKNNNKLNDLVNKYSLSFEYLELNDISNVIDEELEQFKIYILKNYINRPISMYTRRIMDISNIGKYLNLNSAAGRCGSRNLGNTCFMNSSIACLSNCTELTYYFLKGDYKSHINKDNNLGMNGDLAKNWGKLLHQYWVEDTRVGDPSDFKSTISRKYVRFKEYRQQDSKEFISAFLNYLNEDLNRTGNKQYIEMKERGKGETDEICAKRYWDYYLKRNDSIITDLFCGQLKSTITCPDCGFHNITFIPFDILSIPMLAQVRRRNTKWDIINFDFYYLIYSL